MIRHPTHEKETVFNKFHIRQVLRFPTYDRNIEQVRFQDEMEIYNEERDQSVTFPKDS